MENCPIDIEQQEIRSQFIEAVPGISEFGTGMIAAIKDATKGEIDCFRKILENGNTKTSPKTGENDGTIKKSFGQDADNTKQTTDSNHASGLDSETSPIEKKKKPKKSKITSKNPGENIENDKKIQVQKGIQELTTLELQSFEKVLSRLEAAILGVMSPETKRLGYITIELTEKNKIGLREFKQHIALLYRARYVFGLEPFKGNLDYLTNKKWDGSKQLTIFIGEMDGKFYIKSMKVDVIQDESQNTPSDNDDLRDYQDDDGKYFG